MPQKNSSLLDEAVESSFSLVVGALLLGLVLTALVYFGIFAFLLALAALAFYAGRYYSRKSEPSIQSRSIFEADDIVRRINAIHSGLTRNPSKETMSAFSIANHLSAHGVADHVATEPHFVEYAMNIMGRDTLSAPACHSISSTTSIVECEREIKRLQAQLRIATDQENAALIASSFFEDIADIISPHLPKDFGDTTDLRFPISFLDSVPNPYQIIHKFCLAFFSEKFEPIHLFGEIQKQIEKNADGITAKYAKKNHSEFLYPIDMKAFGVSARETADMFLSGTKAHGFFNFNSELVLTEGERFKHQYVLGKTGSGKSVLLRGQIANDIEAGRGVVIITPELGLLNDALSFVPPEREQDVVFFDPGSAQSPLVGFNPFAGKPEREALTLRAGELEIILIRALGDLGVKMRPIFTNTVYALLQIEGTFSDIPRLLDPDDNSFRQSVIPLLDERTADFFKKYDGSRYYREAYEPVINRLDPLLRVPLSETLGRDTLNFPDLLNNTSSIVLCNLSGLRGFQAEVTGQLLLATFQQTFFQRDKQKEADRLPYFFYMDEFQTYATSNEASLKDFLQRARKYKVGICMANQNIKDIPSTLVSSIFGELRYVDGYAHERRRCATFCPRITA